jgi:hypothetical protein
MRECKLKKWYKLERAVEETGRKRRGRKTRARLYGTG